ncbi:F0F1 ATP synthase subunit A [Anseongella ginsenosidimutans]|uniref:F0F1 ATP synthase subunit A n=1 Tax=Anseongella ginsenosidimutans TaxID=496056 RepID=UPI0021CDF89D|nr:F0F1 ATP synthase subunit A [Anseongella ginsenosidimutans]
MHLSRIFTLKNLLPVLAFGVFLLPSAPVKAFQAQEEPAGHEVQHEQEGVQEEEEFDAASAIMHHIADAHEWHIIGHTAIYLPVILYTEDGLQTFSSSHFYHHPQEVTYSAEGKETTETWYKHEGFGLFHEKIYKLDENGALNLDEAGHPLNERVLDFSITKNVAAMLLSVALLLLIFCSMAGAYKKRKGKAPKGLQSALEPIVLFVRDEIALPNIGHQYARFMPFLLTVFFFIWINNIMGLIPFFPGEPT